MIQCLLGDYPLKFDLWPQDAIADMIPPKKHLLRHQPVNAQIGLMDGNTFCTTLEPRNGLDTYDFE